MKIMTVSSFRTHRETFSDGLTVRVDECGSGRAMLVVHGAAGPHSVSGFAEAMAEHAHVLVPTHPGFAGEPRPEWFADVDDLAITYLDLLERRDLREVIVVGFSFGGWIAAEMVARTPTRVGGLLLVDAAGIEVEGHAIKRPGPPPNGPRWPADPPNPEQAAARDANMQALAVYGREGMYDPKLRRRLARVTLPTLVVWGEDDPIIDTDYGRAYAQSFPNARFSLIPGAGHLPQRDQPARLFAIAREFMNGIPFNHAVAEVPHRKSK
jgi:pimeloyl-ACP methyl ester carboxylesterase